MGQGCFPGTGKAFFFVLFFCLVLAAPSWWQTSETRDQIPRHIGENARSITHWATRELLLPSSYQPHPILLREPRLTTQFKFCVSTCLNLTYSWDRKWGIKLTFLWSNFLSLLDPLFILFLSFSAFASCFLLFLFVYLTIFSRYNFLLYCSPIILSLVSSLA